MRLGASAHRELPVNFLLNPASADFADAPTSRQYFDIWSFPALEKSNLVPNRFGKAGYLADGRQQSRYKGSGSHIVCGDTVGMNGRPRRRRFGALECWRNSPAPLSNGSRSRASTDPSPRRRARRRSAPTKPGVVGKVAGRTAQHLGEARNSWMVCGHPPPNRSKRPLASSIPGTIMRN